MPQDVPQALEQLIPRRLNDRNARVINRNSRRIGRQLRTGNCSTRDPVAETCADDLIGAVTSQPLPAWVNADVAANRGD